MSIVQFSFLCKLRNVINEDKYEPISSNRISQSGIFL